MPSGSKSIVEDNPSIETANEQTDEIEDEKSSGRAFSSVAGLDPQVDESFIISFNFRASSFPGLEKRQKLLTKFESQTPPLVGWAIALRRIPSSLRFEVYLRDAEGKGGWYSLAPIEARLNIGYQVTIIISPGSFISAYMQEIGEDNKPLNKSNVVNLGGIPIFDIKNVNNKSALKITSGKPKRSHFNATISDVSIFHTKDLPGVGDFQRGMTEGSNFLFNLFPTGCILSLTDRSDSCIIKQ